MNFLYHIKPLEMRGRILYPLSELKTVYPDLYKMQMKKYHGRKVLLNRKIPLLNCLWNDVLHFTAVHPFEIRAAFSELGVRHEALFYQIEPSVLDNAKTVLFLNRERKRGDFFVDDDEFQPFDQEDLEKYSHLPNETRRFYKEQLENNEKPLLFHAVPHILYKGSLDVTNTPVV